MGRTFGATASKFCMSTVGSPVKADASIALVMAAAPASAEIPASRPVSVFLAGPSSTSFSGRKWQQAGKHLHGGGFAAAIGAEETENFAALNIK